MLSSIPLKIALPTGRGRASSGGPEIVKRHPEPGVPAAVARLVSGGGDPSFSIETDNSALLEALRQKTDEAALIDDIASLATEFSHRTGASRLAVRLERITGPGCKYFHVDYVPLRLIVTYQGPGTEYVLDCDADRAALGSGNNRRIVPDPSRVRQVPQFAAAYFEGEGRGRGRGVVHRSPRASRAKPRLILVIDTADPDRVLTDMIARA
jgi:hypothetical protein